MYHLIAKDKVAEQHILGKHSNCNSFGVTMALLNSRAASEPENAPRFLVLEESIRTRLIA